LIHVPTIRRREFLAALGAGGALLVGFRMEARPADADFPDARFVPNGFIRIDRSGAVTLIIPQAEMGQGVYTSLAMIMGEELDVDWSRVGVEAAPPSDSLYGNPVFGIQATGNSNSIRSFWTPLRKAGAGARALLVEAAAQRWGVDAKTCRTNVGEVIHAASARKLAYGQLVAAASRLEMPADPALKSPAEFKLIGKSLKRLDTPDKVNGKAVYGIDARPPGVRFATLVACPVLGGKVGRVDDGKAKQVPGVRQIVVLDDLVAVVGDHMWAAKQGVTALDVTWVEGPNALVSSESIWRQLRDASKNIGLVARAEGDVESGLRRGQRLDAVYEMPLLAHAAMEPMNCTVHVRDDACEVWVGTQVQTRAQAVAAKVTGLPLEKVVIHNHLLGGGFGRRLEVDGVEKAVRIARRVDGPVKVVWTREEDIQQDLYRPVYRNLLSASMEKGRIAGWTHRVTGSSVVARWLPPLFEKARGIDIDAVDSAANIQYDIPNLRVEYVRDEPPGVITGFWRGVGPNNNVFAVESFIDELAIRERKDPVTFRLELLGKSPRLRAVLQLAASKADWGSALPSGRARGVAAQFAFGSYIATIADVEVDSSGEIRLHRIVTAVDTGIVVNPDTVVAQLQGGIIFGLTAALFGEITLDKGRVQQSNFHDYRALRMNDAPKIDVHLVTSAEAPGGIGETGATAGPPALCNAIFAATGVRVRRLPIDRNSIAARRRVS
jgi:isoquinoline 1-oxidoreductase beta subunit